MRGRGFSLKNLLAALLFLAASAAVVNRAQAQVIVIANPGVKAAEVSKNDLRDVFTGAATTLKDGSRVVPILLDKGTAHEEFLQVYIGKSESAYRAAWRSLVFSGQANMPKSLDGDAAVVDFVAHNNGAIGYINKTSAHEGVKVLTIK
jgi:ABC-type phosphate transport system substrate-binding protein